jgi:hypothetical protein
MHAFLLRFQQKIGIDPRASDAATITIKSATQTATKIAQETSDRDEATKRFRAFPDLPLISAATKTITEVKGEAVDRSLTPFDGGLIPPL